MNALNIPREGWAGLVGIVANSDSDINTFVQVVIHVVGSMMRNINPDFFHDGDARGMDPARVGAGAENIKAIAGHIPQQAMGDLGPAGIPGANKEDFFLFWHEKI